MTIPTTADILNLVLDAERLNDLIGSPLRVTRVRIKPAHSLTLAVVDLARQVPAWLHFLWPGHHHRAEKLRRRAAEHRLRIFECRLGSTILVQGGKVSTDPALLEVMSRARRSRIISDISTTNVLRYNPARRIVIRRGQQVIRACAVPITECDEVEDFLSPRLPIPQRLDGRTDNHIRTHAWVDGTDLSGGQDLTATRKAGEILARLHTLTGRLPWSLAQRLDRRMADVASQCRANAGILDYLAPELAERIRRLPVTKIDLGSERVLCHGDASPDQVLYQRQSQRVWLTDFDRVHIGPSAIDLGSYLATVEADHAEALLEGYQEAGGILPTPERVLGAQYRSMLMRIADPLRAGEPDWREQINRRLTLLEGEMR